MKTTITESTFIDTFRNSNTYKNNFSYNGLCALYDYFTEMEEQIGTEIDFDMVEICCYYTEYKTINDFLDDYDSLKEDVEGYDDEGILEFLNDNTTVIEFEGGVIIQDF